MSSEQQLVIMHMPYSLHRRVAGLARGQGVSINALVNEIVRHKLAGRSWPPTMDRRVTPTATNGTRIILSPRFAW
jgi:hypothetical protein